MTPLFPKLLSDFFDMRFHASAIMSKGSIVKSGRDYHCDYCTYVGMLMTASGGKYLNEPYKAIFDFHGVGDKAIEIAGAYAKQQAQNNISRLFSDTPKPEPIKYIDLGMPKSLVDYKVFSEWMEKKIMDSCGIPSHLLCIPKVY